MIKRSPVTDFSNPYNRKNYPMDYTEEQLTQIEQYASIYLKMVLPYLV